jgi:hypothetical protein
MSIDSIVPHRAAAAILVSWVAVLAGCTGPKGQVAERTAGDTVKTAPAPPAAPATISLAAVVGRWKIHVTDADGANVVDAELVATADSGWSIVSPNRAPIPERVVVVAGDSIVAEAAYESFIRKGVQVRTRDVYRLQDGKLVGTVEGRYATQHGDSATRRRLEGTRVR